MLAFQPEAVWPGMVMPELSADRLLLLQAWRTLSSDVATLVLSPFSFPPPLGGHVTTIWLQVMSSVPSGNATATLGGNMPEHKQKCSHQLTLSCCPEAQVPALCTLIRHTAVLSLNPAGRLMPQWPFIGYMPQTPTPPLAGGMLCVGKVCNGP